MQRNSAAPAGGKPNGKSGRPPSQRQLRVGEVIRHAFAEILQRGEIHDPAFEGKVITVPEVRMAADLKCATVYVMPLGGQGAEAVVEAFDRNKKFLRGEISRRVNLRIAPELRFRVDESFEAAGKIDALLRSPEVTRDVDADGADGKDDPVVILMANRKRKGRDVSGWLCLDKAAGQTSTDAVASVKRLFGAEKAGHAGTLDPLATGALPIAFGEATKTVPFVQDGRKIYRFTVRWGVETDTDDAEGKATATAEVRPDRAAIEALLPEFTGDIMQRPPAYSAIKVEGERAYDLARGGGPVELAERPVAVHRLAVIEIPDTDHAVFEAECGKGTYVRSLARDLGRRLASFGHVVALRRLTVGPFDEATMVPLATLIAAREAGDAHSLDRYLAPIGFALSALPEVAVVAADAARIGRGQPVLIRGRDAPLATAAAHATHGGATIALGEIAEGQFHPKRVFKARG